MSIIPQEGPEHTGKCNKKFPGRRSGREPEKGSGGPGPGPPPQLVEKIFSTSCLRFPELQKVLKNG